MKRNLLVAIFVLLIISLTACTINASPPLVVNTVTPETPSESAEASLNTPTPEPSPTDTASVTPTTTPSDTPSSTPSSTVSASDETPDHAGSGNVLFDIYKGAASVDLNKDGTEEKLSFTQGSTKSTISINGTSYTINHSGLAQLFAVTDIDTSDNNLELAFTDKYSSDLADTEFPSTYLYWWNGTGLKEMGGLTNVKIDGTWRSDFKASDFIKGNGEVYCLASTNELTNVWYMERFKAYGSDRKLKEESYATKPVGTPGNLTIKTGKACLLLSHAVSTFFGNSYNSMWDYAGWPHSLGRAKNPNSDIVIIAQAGETLKIVGVFGQNWLKLQTSDNYKGWIKAVDGNVQGYYKVMHYTGSDIFDGIVNAG